MERESKDEILIGLVSFFNARMEDVTRKVDPDQELVALRSHLIEKLGDVEAYAFIPEGSVVKIHSLGGRGICCLKDIPTI